MRWRELLSYAKKAWRYVWYGESVWSWLLSLLLAFVIIKFLLYPGFGLLLGTEFPIVAVVSNSMEHEGSFDEWWAVHSDFYLQESITRDEFQDYPFSDGFNKGDIMVLIGTQEDTIERGEVLVFWSGKSYPIIHRVTRVWVDEESGERYYETKGDNNRNQVVQPPILDETNVRPDQVVGKAVGRIPYLGYVKIWFVELIGLFIRA